MYYIVQVDQVLRTKWAIEADNGAKAIDLALECWEDGDSMSIDGYAETQGIDVTGIREATEEEIRKYRFEKE